MRTAWVRSRPLEKNLGRLEVVTTTPVGRPENSMRLRAVRRAWQQAVVRRLSGGEAREMR